MLKTENFQKLQGGVGDSAPKCDGFHECPHCKRQVNVYEGRFCRHGVKNLETGLERFCIASGIKVGDARVWNFPRRSRIDLDTPPEAAIRKAIDAVEDAGAHPLLTEAVNLLGQAKDKVSDFVELERK